MSSVVLYCFSEGTERESVCRACDDVVLNPDVKCKVGLANDVSQFTLIIPVENQF